MPRKLRVFLCHASQDKLAVRALYSALKTEGWIDPWLDKAKILPGQDWRMVIEKAVEDTDVVIVCLSNQSVSKEGFVQREIKYAYDIALEKPEETIFLIPLRLDDCAVPRGLRSFHYTDYFGAEKRDAYSDLLEALKLRHEQKLDLEEEKIIRKQVGKMLKRPTEMLVAEKVDYESEPLPHLEKKKFVRGDESVKPELPVFAMGLFTFVIISIFVWGIYNWNKQKASPALLPTETPAATELPIDTEALAVTEPPALGIGSTMVSEKDGMVLVYVPAGTFTMGSDDNPNEQPIHTVYLDAFWIDQTEVTNKQYQACVDASTCEPPSSTGSETHPNYYGSPEFGDYPVIYVNWDKANRYCEVWSGGDLPTEAQWEKAARGTDARTYPWGNDAPNSNLLNYNNSDTAAVKSYESGKSIYGAYDMAGNVWEWVNDWYDETYYQSSLSTNNPLGPESGQYRVMRGYGWGNDGYVSSAFRGGINPSDTGSSIGFRCSRSQP